MACIKKTSCNDTRHRKVWADAVQVEKVASHASRSYYSVNFFHSWTARTTSCLIYLHHDWIDNPLELFLLSFEFFFLSELILVQPIQGFLHGFFNLFFIVTFKFVFEFLLRQCVAHGEAVVFQAVLGLNLGFVLLILSAIFLCLLHHAIDVGLGQSSLLISNCDLVGLACRLVLGG